MLQEQVSEKSDVGLDHCLDEGTGEKEVPPEVDAHLEIEKAQKDSPEDEDDAQRWYGTEEHKREDPSDKVVILSIDFHVFLI